MKIQINSDKQIVVDAMLSSAVESEIRRALERFEPQLTRVEVHLRDLNSNKPGPRDKRCQLETRPAGRQPVSVAHEARTVEQSVRAAAAKMKRLLQTSFGRAASRISPDHSRPGKRVAAAA